MARPSTSPGVGEALRHVVTCALAVGLCVTAGAAFGPTTALAGAPNTAGQPADLGAVTGVVHLAPAPSRRLPTPGAYPTRRIGVASSREASELEHVVVYIRRARPTSTSPVRAVVRQIDEEFVPHVLAVTTGSVVEFPNEDLVFHNVFSLSKAATFDLGRYPQRASRSIAFKQPGLVKVYCHLHSHMSAIVRVFDHPYFAAVGSDGRFRIEGLEPGRHEVVAWHERLGETSASVVVVAGGAPTDVKLSLPLED